MQVQLTAGICALALSGAAIAGDAIDRRDIQIKSIDFTNSVVEVHNYGLVGQVLVGWRFCTHDSDQVRRYTSSTGLNSVSIEAGTSIFIHVNNDATVDADNINVSTLGGTFASPLDPDAYGLQLYFPSITGSVSFSNSSLISDHVQWNTVDGPDGAAEARTSQAVSEGLWSATGDFVVTQADSERFDLTDLGDGRSHGSSNYTVTNPSAPCLADLTGEGSLDFADVSAFLTLFSSGDLSVDFDMSGGLDFADVSAFLSFFAAGCP